MSMLNGQPQVATEQHTKLRWGGRAPGERFRCYFCGHKFKAGDYWRFQMSKHGNFLVCDICDDDNREELLQRWEEHVERAKTVYWWKE